jgi:type IV secretion/conjugal transfer VirB4 family ATPase
MLNLSQFRRRKPGLPDLLNWGVLIANGVVLNKDGSLEAGFFYRGSDVDSSPDSKLNWVSDQMNAALSFLTGGWTINLDAIRMPAPNNFPLETSHFPDPVSQMIDDERRAHFMASGRHYETEYAITLNYMPPARAKGRLLDLIYSGEDDSRKTPATQILAEFERQIQELEDALSGIIELRRMRDYVDIDPAGQQHQRSELVNYLHFTLTGEHVALNLPESGCYLDTVVGGKEAYTGNTPLIGDTFYAIVAIMGYPATSVPGILAMLDHMQVPMRYSSRFIATDATEARRVIKSIERKWKQRLRGFWSEVLQISKPRIDKDAETMSAEATDALSRTNSALVGTGYYTPVIVLSAASASEVMEHARQVSRELIRIGFSPRIETVNAMEAWLGSLPAHTVPNVRRPLIHTDNLADMLPLTAVWTGSPINPSPYYPPNSPALFQAATSGSAPFWMNIAVGDVLHTLIFGPIGSGKSVLLSFMMAQARRYQGMTIWAFDKGRTMMPVTMACGGQHYDIGTSDKLSFCPLGILDTNSDIAAAEEWIAACFELQHGEQPNTTERDAIHQAIELMRHSTGGRSLTDFWGIVQSDRVKDAIQFYTVQGQAGRLLDAERDGLADGDLITFEVDELMGMGPQTLIPVLLYLFRRFERQLRGQPALLLLDEAWIMLGHSVFREKIREWLKTLRKANCGVIMATQSLSDAHRSSILDVLLESMPTKIFLPNSEAATTGTAEHPGPAMQYLAMGLNEAQIATIAQARPKRHYYVTSIEGSRLIELQLGPKALAFVGSGFSKEQLARIKVLEARYGKEWPQVWLRETGQAKLPRVSVRETEHA